MNPNFSYHELVDTLCKKFNCDPTDLVEVINDALYDANLDGYDEGYEAGYDAAEFDFEDNDDD